MVSYLSNNGKMFVNRTTIFFFFCFQSRFRFWRVPNSNIKVRDKKKINPKNLEYHLGTNLHPFLI